MRRIHKKERALPFFGLLNDRIELLFQPLGLLADIDFSGQMTHLAELQPILMHPVTHRTGRTSDVGQVFDARKGFIATHRGLLTETF